MKNIKLIFNNGYQWHSRDGISFKGFVFDDADRFYPAQEAISLFEGITCLEELARVCNTLDGSWSVIIEGFDGLLAAVDAMSMFPLFYTYDNGQYRLSDSAEWLAQQGSNQSLNREALTEFRAAGFVTGDQTLLDNILRIKPGEAISLPTGKQDTNKITWHYFLPEMLANRSQEELENEFISVLDLITKKLLSSINGQTLVVPLSGGYDSRLIACLLKKAGVEKVICFTYGRPNPEAEISKKVADKLGFRWIFVDYDKLHTSSYLKDQVFRDYCSCAGNHTSMPYLQEYFGVKHLKDHNLIPEDSIFLPGHSGDYLGGSYVHKTIRMRCDWNDATWHIANHYFPFLTLSQAQLQGVNARLHHWFNNYAPPPSATDPDYCVYIEDWDVKEKLAKFIFNSASVFPCFGYEVRFPLWDKILRSFFRGLPFKYRLHKNLYDSVLISQYFKPMNVFFDKQELSAPAKSKLAKTAFQIRQSAGKLIRPIFPTMLIKSKLRRNDWICYHRFTKDMLREMQQKKHKAPKRFNAYNALICEWYIMKTKELSQKEIT